MAILVVPIDNGGRGMKTWFNIAAKDGGTAVEIDIFDEIGFWGITAKDFVTELRGKLGNASSLTLNIDCPGGDCSDGFTIFDAIKQARDAGVKVTANVTGLAASMASVIILAAEKIRIAENGRVMIHRVTAGGFGNADELEAVSEVARQFEDRIVGLYVARSGKKEEEIRELMKTPIGTWFFGEEAVQNGFADEVIKGAKAKAFQPRWASKFAMLPAALFDMQSETDGAHASASPQHTDQTPMKNTLILLARASGITVADDATEDQLNAAIVAHKPAAVVAELNLEDPETKSRFEAAVEAAVKPLREQLTGAVAEVDRLKTLASNGALGAAMAAAPVQNATAQREKKELTRAEFNNLSPAARSEFSKKGGKIID